MKTSSAARQYRNLSGGVTCIPAVKCLILAAAVLSSCESFILAGTPEEIRLVDVGPRKSFDRPVHLTFLPGSSRELVVVEQRGTIQRFTPGSGKKSKLFLDIRSRVNSGGWEEGLLSMAFHPRHAENGVFFVYYSAAPPRRSVVARMKPNPSGSKAAPFVSEVLLEIPQPYANHNGGQIAFGADGMLYIALGDGGSGGDPMGNGQNRRTLLGAILRIDVNRSDPGIPFAIPPDNPFSNAKDGTRPEIWAFGLRNPWRFSFDRVTGLLYAADVGQNDMEEVNIIRKGGNHGWNVLEGTRCFRPSTGCDAKGMILPLAEYSHRQGKSITGGFVYRGKKLDKLLGRYLFADYVSGSLWSIPSTPPGPHRLERLLKTTLSISSFGEDREGELYLLDHAGGRVYRIASVKP